MADAAAAQAAAPAAADAAAAPEADATAPAPAAAPEIVIDAPAEAPPESDAQALGKVGAALQSAKKRTLEEYAAGVESSKVPIPDRHEIKIAGERVRLEETGFREGSGEYIVSFRKRYFPQAPDNVITKAKQVFYKIFSSKDINDIIPPCDVNEREILSVGLSRRILLLWDEIQYIRINKGDIANLRNKIKHFNQLDLLIKDFDKYIKRGTCEDYNDDGTSKGFRRIDNAMEEEIRTLLRQFAFIILQAHSPVKEYSESTDDARELINTLRQNKLSREQMDEYLKLWREQAEDTGEGVPVILGEILAGTDTQTGVLEVMLDDAINSLYTEIVKQVRDNYATVPELITLFEEEFKRNLDEKDPRKKLLALIRWIINKNRECWEKLGASQKEIKELTDKLEESRQIKLALDAKVVELEQNIGELHKHISAGLTKIKDLDGQVADRDSRLRTSKTELGLKTFELATARSNLTNAKAAAEALTVSMAAARKKEEEATAAAAAAVAAQKACAQAASEGKAAADAALVSENQKLKGEKASSDASIKNKDKTLLETTQALALEKDTRTKADGEILRLLALIKASADKEAQLATDLAEANAAIHQNTQGKKAEIGRIEAELAAAKADTARKQTQLDLALEAKDAADEAAAGQASTIESLKADKATAESKAAELAAAIKGQEQLNAQLSAAQRARDETINGRVKQLSETIASNEALIKTLTGQQNAATAAAAAAEAAVKEERGSTQGLIDNLKQFAQSIKDGEDTVPPELVPGASDSFNEILTKIREIKTEGAAPGNEICFLSYFITFFMKFLFFTGPNPEDIKKRKALMESLEAVAKKVGGDKVTLYRIMGVIFKLLDAGEMIFLNNKDREGGNVFNGLSVIQIVQAPGDAEIVDNIFKDLKGVTAVPETLNSIKKSLLDNMQITQPNLYVLPPIASLPQFPILARVADVSRRENKKIQVIDVEDGYSSRIIDANEGVIRKALDNINTNIHYTTLLAAFVVFGRNYILAAKEDLNKYKCKVPAGLENTSLLAGLAVPDLMAARSASLRQGVGAAQGAAQAAALTSGESKIFGSISPLGPPVYLKEIIHLTPDNPEQTFPLILKEIAGGATVTSGSFEKIINSKIDVNLPPNERSKLLKLQPIIQLIKSYNTTSPFWRGVKFDAMSSQLISNIWTKLQENIKGDDTNRTRAKTYFTNLIYNMALAYTRQYNIKSITTADQIKKYFGDILISQPGTTKQTTVYSLLNITNDKLIAFINNPPALITSGADEGLHLKKQ